MLLVIIKGIMGAAANGIIPVERAIKLGKRESHKALRWPRKITDKKRTALTIGPVTAWLPIKGEKSITVKRVERVIISAVIIFFKEIVLLFIYLDGSECGKTS